MKIKNIGCSLILMACSTLAVNAQADMFGWEDTGATKTTPEKSAQLESTAAPATTHAETAAPVEAATSTPVAETSPAVAAKPSVKPIATQTLTLPARPVTPNALTAMSPNAL